jgi:hypothetical protein
MSVFGSVSALTDMNVMFRGPPLSNLYVVMATTHLHICRLVPINYLTHTHRRDRIRGTVCFFLGIFLVILRWGLIGMSLEVFGFLNLFGNFLPIVLTVGRQIPVLGKLLDLPIIAQAVDFLAGKTRPKYSV